MYPLGALSMTLFALILFSWMQTSRGYFGFVPSRWTADPVTRQAGSLLTNRNASAHPQPAEQLRDFGYSVEGSVLRWIQYMNVIATVAPMVGLLGTVSGMIGAFQTIATGGMGKPELLAGDIGEALITTATGLTIGIPAMVFYFVLKNRLDSRMEEFEQWIQSDPGASERPGD